ncbi:hypothetical protein BGZ60DRAFT_239019 [Tricladium varicosporioides]|nr:hypothetical protein BGZ60DRAFT_239019 [Hymenoscyphus varicosporioides]
MAFIHRLPGAFAVLLMLQSLSRLTLAQSTSQHGTNTLPTFGDTVKVLGRMERTDQDFKDGLRLDLMSPKNRTLVVGQNPNPLGAQFITGTTGQPFVALQNFSYVIQMNETANDLIAKVEIPYDTSILAKMGIEEANTYVATLAPDKRSWVVDDATRNVHRSENNTRIMKMTTIDGEYRLVGRRTIDSSNMFIQYGSGSNRMVNLTGGPGLQQAEFIDGLRFSIQCNEPINFNVELKEGVNPGTLPANTISLNSYAWIVRSTAPFLNVDAQMMVPFNRAMLTALRPMGSSPSTMLTVAKRPLNATSGQFIPLNADAQVVHELTVDKIELPNMTQLDGQYLILVTTPKPVGATGVQPAKRSLHTKRTPGRRRRSLDLNMRINKRGRPPTWRP